MPERKSPASAPQTLHTLPLTAPDPEPKKLGRPRKSTLPALPTFEMNALETEWFTYFLQAYREEYPDLTKSDQILLVLAGVEYIKYLRIIQNELKTGELITMARQHSGVQMRALLDMLSVTRKARQSGKREEDPQLAKAREALLTLSESVA